MAMDMEQIVREVVAELERNGQAVGKSECAPAAQTPTSDQTRPPKNDPRELVVSSRVVSLAEIEDRLGTIRRLVVPPRAVITPAARDALEDRGIAVTFAEVSDRPMATASKLLLVAALTPMKPCLLADALRSGGIDVETQTSECLIQTADTLAGRVRDGRTLGVVLTPHVAAAICLANRLPGVRAVSVAHANDVARAARAVGANVLVIDPQGKGLFQLRQAVGEFFRSGPWPCPEVLKSRLG